MRWDMEILSPSSYYSNSSWLLEESLSMSTRWTPAENKAFENALALFDENTPDRWHRVAAMVPGKTVGDVIRQYKELEDDVSSIEAGLIPVPGYSTTSPFTLEWGSGHAYEGFKQSFVSSGGRRSSSGRPSDQERKKGVPWTEEEHKLFLMGLKKYGKGDWRNISRNYVITRTPTQVASHAQKYFIRQLSGGKDKRRASIHDITTVNLNDNQTPSPDSKKQPSPDQSSILAPQSNSTAIQKLPFQWDQTSNEAVMGFSSPCHGSMFTSSSPYGMNYLQRGAIHDSYMGSQNMVFQMQSELHYPNA